MCECFVDDNIKDRNMALHLIVVVFFYRSQLSQIPQDGFLSKGIGEELHQIPQTPV